LRSRREGDKGFVGSWKGWFHVVEEFVGERGRKAPRQPFLVSGDGSDANELSKRRRNIVK